MVTDTEWARGRTMVKRRRAHVLRHNPHPVCHLCGLPIDLEIPYPESGSFVVDHVVPLAKGGTDTPDNWAPAHRACNSRKSDKLMPADAQRVRDDALTARLAPMLHSGSVLIPGCSCSGCLRYVHREPVATARGAAA